MERGEQLVEDRKSTRLNFSHSSISYAVFCLKKKKRLRANERQVSETYNAEAEAGSRAGGDRPGGQGDARVGAHPEERQGRRQAASARHVSCATDASNGHAR